MQTISKVEGQVNCIPNNTEKYISFSLNQLRFIDSAQFLLAPLEKLVAANEPEAFKISAQYEPDDQKRQLLLRKGVYPYEYMSAWECFEETQLPPKEDFYSKLSDAHISDSDYAHAQNIWRTFECRTLGDYTDLYCRADVLLLADVFENFRKTCQKQYKLDPAHYYTSPGLSWDALLKKTESSNCSPTMTNTSSARRACEEVSRWYRSATPGQTIQPSRGYNPQKPNTSILYLDANNLYGWAMSQHLPTGGFRWVDDCNQLASAIADHPPDAAKGYIVEVDLDYPRELHGTHNAYPLAPERLVVQRNWMSEYQRALMGGGRPPRSKSWSPTSETRSVT
ncbi:protein NYNRIN [Elysia marginata]|uniref:Protein NYNRIN n=1 Tax=Elysia marginata TaxID=1093978 RepID=A0AAV4F0U8_9GAST|nr:protein NYNRIN [Elysia marginata]